MQPWNPKEINPALMTSSEYMKLCNKDDKWHDSSAYNWTVKEMNDAEYVKKAKYKKIRTFKANGISFDLMFNSRRIDYCQRDPEGEYIRVDGKLVPYTDEEIKRLGYQPYEYTFAIFDGETCVATAQDEWGAMLITVAKEYREFGLGTIIGKIARTYEPGKSSGGFTPAGARNFIRIHREFVRDALASGLYSKLVRSGQITMDRVREIIRSAKVQQRPDREGVDLSSNSPKDWLLFADLHGSYVLYDRKLAHVVDTQYEGHFVERMVKGYVYAMPDDTAGIVRIKQFGGDSTNIKAFMLSLAYTTAKMHDLPLWVEADEYDLPGFTYGEETNVVGYRSKEVLTGKMVNYIEMVEEEKRFRKRFDQYDEFKSRLHEIAHGKYQ